MRILFVHDGPLITDKQGNHYGIAHNNEMFQRYYAIADDLAVIMREREFNMSESKEKYSKITVKPFEFVASPNIGSLSGLINNRKNVKKLIANEVKKSDYIVARIPSFLGNLTIDIAQKLKKPYLVELVTCPWDAFWNHSFKGKIIAPYMYCQTKERIQEAPYVVYVTNEFLQNRYPTQGKNTNCSNVALTDFNEKIFKKRIAKIKNSPTHNKVILGTTAAVDVRFKGQEYIIKALGRLKKQGITNYEYQLVGAGDQDYLRGIAQKNNVEEQVKFLGPMPHKKVFGWLETIDIYVQPSKQEGLPRALIEAMSRGVPSFGAKTAGIPELLEPKYIFEHGFNSIDDINKIILSFNKESMLLQSKANYKESKKYDRKSIETRRNRFFTEFKEDYENINE